MLFIWHTVFVPDFNIKQKSQLFFGLVTADRFLGKYSVPQYFNSSDLFPAPPSLIREELKTHGFKKALNTSLSVGKKKKQTSLAVYCTAYDEEYVGIQCLKNC